MSLREREDGADDDAEPEDLPNLVRRERQSYRVRANARRGLPFPLHPAMDRTAGFFRVKSAPSVLGGAVPLWGVR